jgi:exodeoxyribonuclease VII small subunit
LDSNDRANSAEGLPDFEAALRQLEGIVRDLEEGEVGLAEALAKYEQGVKLLRTCYGVLEHAERRIEVLSGFDARGNPLAEPFDEAEPLPLEEKAQARSRRRSKPSAGASGGSAGAGSEMDEPQDLF